MLVEMAKEKSEKEEPKESFFPRLLLAFSIVLITLAIVNLFNFFYISSFVTNLVLLLSGLWMLKVGISVGVYKKRTGAIKKYI